MFLKCLEGTYCPHLHGSMDHWTHANESNTFLWEPCNQWRGVISQKPESSITVMWGPKHSSIHPHERYMEPHKQDLVETLMARMWKLCRVGFAWKLGVVTWVYIRVSYFVMLGFENLVEEFLHLWILKVIPVYCWHKVRKIIVIECVWKLQLVLKFHLLMKCDN